MPIILHILLWVAGGYLFFCLCLVLHAWVHERRTGERMEHFMRRRSQELKQTRKRFLAKKEPEAFQFEEDIRAIRQLLEEQAGKR